jgi:hypothetical protein
MFGGAACPRFPRPWNRYAGVVGAFNRLVFYQAAETSRSIPKYRKSSPSSAYWDWDIGMWLDPSRDPR